ncbi:hypothetical protein EDC96DRAFT_433827 [Choanephora cucurbitarum]|nr:hypothetical protein EDC96DRAFT_433827 [Choanephora cucurbitarum]
MLHLAALLASFQTLLALPVNVYEPSHNDQQDEYWWPAFINVPLVKLLGDSCYQSLFEEFHFTDTFCLKLAVSKALGLGIVVGGAIIKIPQIFTIVRHKSAKGLSLASFLLETCAYMIVLMYNLRLHNPFSTFGEVAFMTLQNIFISYLIVIYATQPIAGFSKSSLMIGLSIGFVGGFICLGMIPSWLMSLLYAAQIPIGLASKVPQIKLNYLNKSTGQLSAFAVLNYFIGTTARAFTTWTELDDPIMLGGNILASILNGVLVVQLFIYRKQKLASYSSVPVLMATATAEKAD